MEHPKTKSMTNQQSDKQKPEDLDKLLSMRGKPFADWKEERRYLREKWGMQGAEIKLDKKKKELIKENPKPLEE